MVRHRVFLPPHRLDVVQGHFQSFVRDQIAEAKPSRGHHPRPQCSRRRYCLCPSGSRTAISRTEHLLVAAANVQRRRGGRNVLSLCRAGGGSGSCLGPGPKRFKGEPLHVRGVEASPLACQAIFSRTNFELESVGVKAVLLPARSPNLNRHASYCTSLVAFERNVVGSGAKWAFQSL